MSYRAPSPSPSPPPEALHPHPPVLELPVFRAQLIDDEENRMNVDEGLSDEEPDADTKKSFDFTGEIKKLNASGASHRRSFVEQLENAFRTPAKIDFRYGFELEAPPPLPPLPKLPGLRGDDFVRSDGKDGKDSSHLRFNMTATTEVEMERDTQSQSKSKFDSYSGSQILDIKEPTLLPGSDSLASGSDETHDSILDMDDSVSASVSTKRSLATSPSSGSRPSDGQLNKAFKFGGLAKTKPPPLPTAENKPQTLSDIIPPPSHVRSLSGSSMMDEDDSVLKSIFAKVSDIPPLRPRPRANSDSSAKQPIVSYRHSRHSSGLSFVGFDSFDEVRRGFEFGSDRAPFYPPPLLAVLINHGLNLSSALRLSRHTGGLSIPVLTIHSIMGCHVCENGLHRRTCR